MNWNFITITLHKIIVTEKNDVDLMIKHIDKDIPLPYCTFFSLDLHFSKVNTM